MVDELNLEDWRVSAYRVRSKYIRSDLQSPTKFLKISKINFLVAQLKIIGSEDRMATYASLLFAAWVVFCHSTTNAWDAPCHIKLLMKAKGVFRLKYWPWIKIVYRSEIYGNFQSGMTSWTMHCGGEWQKFMIMSFCGKLHVPVAWMIWAKLISCVVLMMYANTLVVLVTIDLMLSLRSPSECLLVHDNWC